MGSRSAEGLMSELWLQIKLRGDAGWEAAWRVEGASLGPTLPVQAAEARPLFEACHEFERCFIHRDGEGRTARPLVPAAALDSLGQELFRVWCAPSWDAIRPHLRGRCPLVIQSDRRDVLNVPWNLPPTGGDPQPIGGDPAWALSRTPLPQVVAPDGPLPPGPL